jgi:hypothetical protein
LLALGMAVAGGLGGWSAAWWRGAADGERSPPSVVVAAAPGGMRGAMRDADDLAQVEGELAAVRVELARLAARSSAGPEGAKEREGGEKAAVAAVTTPEQVVIEERAVAQVERAIERGRWGDEDRAILRSLLGGLNREQHEAVMSQLVMALNEGKLQLDPMGSLL